MKMEQKPIDLNQFYLYSISYEKANAEIRGKFSFFPEQVASFSEQIQSQNLGAAFIVSTCNRTELYLYSEKPKEITRLFAEKVSVPIEAISEYAVIKNGKDALNHLFRVSAGLESQILGDFEIISQIKTWVKRFQAQGVLNSFMVKAVDTALQISKKIKSETFLSNGTASVSFAAVNYIFNSPKAIESVLLIGTGKIGLNTAESLVKHLPNLRFTLLNRTAEKAEKLASKLDVEYALYENMKEEIAKADAVIVSTNAPQPIVNASHIPTDKFTLFLDLSIPNNIDPEIAQLENVQLLNVDILSKQVDETLERRTQEVPKAEEIISEHLIEFEDWIESRKFAPIIKEFKENLDLYNQFNSKELRKKEVHINGKETLLAEKLAQKITNRFADYILENPEKADETADLFKHIFHLDSE